ncbi:peptidase S33, tripeptidyl-peptidase [Xylariales sp. PMI_506]|nr:peptidase S33, tripeptidyl-peptidase [Xylariales sp. PMI_506]
MKSSPGLVFIAATSLAESAAAAIQWQACDTSQFSAIVSLDCADLPVPLDYTAPNSTDTLQLQLIRTAATVQPSKGSILFNFGGPGEPDRDNFAEVVSLLLPLTGGEYDLVSFDTRGTENTLPLNCYANDFEAERMIVDLSQTSNSSDQAPARLWARAGVDANLCYERAQVNGSLISTPFTARDLISIVDALDEDGMLRYYGFSYGTTLGFTVAAMFPDRVDKMILDGVQNPQEYYNAHADYQEWTLSDKVFSGMFETCVAAGPNCTLNQLNATAAELEQATWDLLEQLRENPVPFGYMILDYSLLKNIIQSAIYGPAQWPSSAALLTAFLSARTDADFEEIAQLVGLQTDSPTTEMTNLQLYSAISGIHCSDRGPRLAGLDELQPVLAELYGVSAVMGDAEDLATIRCGRWLIDPKERYEGGFTVETANPVLFVANTWDGLTPIVSAYNVSSGFNGSAVLEVHGYGHTSLQLPSKCTIESTVAYWANRTLPSPGTVCPVDAVPYSNTTWNDIVTELGWSFTTGFPEGFLS